MKNLFLFLFLITSISYSAEVEYTLGTFKSGTPYVRLVIPNNSTNWTCFNEPTYTRFLELTLDKTSADSIYSNMKIQLEQCNDINVGLTTSLRFSHENQTNLKSESDSLLIKYNETSKAFAKESFKKWYWGGLGVIGGALVGALATALFSIGK